MNREKAVFPFVRGAQLLLMCQGIVFVGIGGLFLLWPMWLSAFVSISLPNSTALVDFRAVYGGLQCGVGSFLLICAWQRQWLMHGLLACVCCFGGLALARGFSLLLTPTSTSINLVLLLAEILGLCVGFIGLIWLQSAKKINTL